MNYKVAKYEIKNPRWSKNKLVSLSGLTCF